MEELEALLAGLGKKNDEETLIANDAAQVWREKFVPIAGLKPGDKVRWKEGCKDKRHGEYGDIFEVFDIISPPIVNAGENGSNHQLDIVDFSLASWKGECFQIYGFDSRRFELVEG